MNNTQIDIVVPTINSSATLDWTLLSLYKLIEFGVSANIYVIDSGSTDGTLAIAEKYGFMVYYYPKGSMYKAINFGLGIGKSPWCSYLNSDDVIYSYEYAEFIQYAEKNMVDIAYGNIDFIDKDGRFLHSWNSPSDRKLNNLYKTNINPIPQVGTIFRRRVYEGLNGFDDKYKYVSDYDFFYRALISGVRYMKYPGKTIAAFRIHDNQFSQVNSIQMEDEAMDVRMNKNNKVSLFKEIYDVFKYRCNNILNYGVRIMRYYQLVGSIGMIKTTEINKGNK